MPSAEPLDLQRDADLGRRLTALTIGIDRLERRLSGGHGILNGEGLVPIYLGDDLVPADQLEGWEQAFERLNALTREVWTYPEGPRRSFLFAMLESLRCAAQLFRGDDLGFREKLERLVGVPAEPVPTERLEAMQLELDGFLTREGHRQGGLSDKARRWEEERFLASEEVEPTFTALMREAQSRTDAMVFPTRDYTMRLNPVRGVPYTARCDFSKGQMDLNVDLRFTRSALKHLVAHEVFPGHSTQLLYTLEATRNGTSTTDVLLCTANTVVGTIQEGIGDQGVHLIDWIESNDDAIHMGLRRLRTAAATSAAWYQVAEGWPLEQVRDFLDQTCFPQTAWLEGRLRFAAHPFRGPFIASYWFGDEAVREVRERAGKQHRTEFIRYLYERMHSPASLRMFETV